MSYITRFFLNLLNLIIPIPGRDIEVPIEATPCLASILPTATTPSAASILPAVATPSIFGIFALDPTGWDPDPTIHVSVMRVDISRSQTEYWVMCYAHPWMADESQSPPCNFLAGVSVTVNPTEMMLNIRRVSFVGRMGRTTIDGTMVRTSETTRISVGGQVTCEIQGSTSASCVGNTTSSFWFQTAMGNDTWGHLTRIETRTVFTSFTDVAAHSIPATITAGFEELPTTTTATTSWNGGGARATGRIHAVLAGVALVGGVVLM
ncbi:hypothetical protein F5144DRAFT_353923 [Chaetomium tenue]|uniref:Uncharacterized protein n=1 Tax=Chaetomium tenue TaxID=1854479 RepID=A0ACB7NZV2_9PEZI|nr:hypothetical protein F5144DRAFT_353923 [Chaetomium globosum]